VRGDLRIADIGWTPLRRGLTIVQAIVIKKGAVKTIPSIKSAHHHPRMSAAARMA
jgi:hypothetical protein